MKQHIISRRDFIQSNSMAAAALVLASPFTSNYTEPDIRVACCASNFHGFRGGADPLPAIRLIGEMGFDGIELIILSRADIPTIWSGQNLDKILQALEAGKLTVSRLGLFGPFFTDIISDDKVKRNNCLDHIRKACKVAKQLGATQIGYTGWPVPGTNPNVYTLRKEALPGEKLNMPLPSGMNWKEVWNQTVESTKRCLEIAQSFGLTICLEPHFHGIPQSAEQFLLLYHEIKNPALGYLLDTCWTTIQCAYPPLLTKMMAPHITNVQFRDTDAGTRNAFVSFGEGVVDFSATINQLKLVGYKGFVSLEEVFMKPDVATADARNFLAFMRKELSSKLITG